MNTNKNGMRALLASAAAGALILGSAAGAMADEATTTAPAPVVKLQKVDIHRHSPINVDKPRDLKVRLTVRTTPAPVAAPTAVVTLEQFTKKVNGQKVTTPVVGPLQPTFDPATSNEAKTVWTLKGKVDKALLAALAVDPDTTGPLTAPLPDGASALLCISTVDLTPDATAYSMQTARRLGFVSEGGPAITKKVVRECVKVYNPKAKPAKPAKS